MSCTSVGLVSYANSKWVAASLPVQYLVHSNKWPTNNFDSTDEITAITDDNGFAKVELVAASETYVEREYIQITDSSVEAYDGIWQIITKHSATEFTINVGFSTTATGDWQRYYNNYHVKAKVYTGIPSGHALEANRPMELRGTVNVKPNAEGEAIIDISSYVRSDLAPFTNRLCEILEPDEWIGNDWYMWTGFYIEFAESHDVSNGSEVLTFTSDYQPDLDGLDTNYYYASNSVHQFQHFQGKSMGEYAIQDTSPDEVKAKFMTKFDEPIYFEGWEFDVSILVSDPASLPTGYDLEYTLIQYDAFGNVLGTDTDSINYNGAGQYRFAFDCYSFNASTATYTLKIDSTPHMFQVSEEKTFQLNRDCAYSPIYLRWLNIHGGWEGWYFRAKKAFGLDIKDRTLTRRNIFSDWDNTFRTSDTMDDYIATEAYREVEIETKLLTEQQIDSLQWIRLSNKVYEIRPDTSVECGTFRQITVLILPSSFVVRKDTDRYYTLSFTMRYTDQILLQNQ